MNKIFFLIFCCLVVFGVCALTSADSSASLREISINSNVLTFKANVNHSNVWQTSCAPKITIEKAETTSVRCVSSNKKGNKEFTYSVDLNKNIENIILNEKEIKLKITIYICSTICKFEQQELRVSCDDLKHQLITYKTSIITTNNSANDDDLDIFKYIYIVFIAFIGGMLLNIMPCVLPVIFMKMKMLVSSANDFRSRRLGIAGIITGNFIAFLSFATCIAFLKLTGESVNWGMHFQNLKFLIIITVVLFLLTLYSFEIIIYYPSIEFNYKSRNIFINNCISGVISTIVAIPCTAPFLGTAAAFAIQGTLFNLFFIFAIIAFGFSFPFILILFINPKVFAIFSVWSLKFKYIFNIGMLLTCLWMLFILSKLLPAYIVFLYCIAFIIIGILFKFKNNLIAWCGTILVCLSVLFVDQLKTNNITITNDWKVFNCNSFFSERARNVNLRDQVVIVNVTADWCMTCQYNKINVFNSKEFKVMIKHFNVACLEGNLNEPNDELIKFINRYKRVGIPFTIVYGPKALEGILLSELISKDVVRTAFEKASGKKMEY